MWYSYFHCRCPTLRGVREKTILHCFFVGSDVGTGGGDRLKHQEIFRTNYITTTQLVCGVKNIFRRKI